MPSKFRKENGRSVKTNPQRDYELALRLVRADRDAGVPQVLPLLRRAVAGGHGPAEYALATWYLFGVGVKKDASRGATLLGRAVKNGVAEAAADLAVSYERGLGVSKSLSKAFQLYKKAARLGDQQSEYEVGRCYYWGIGVHQDRARAERWFARAREHKVQDILDERRPREHHGYGVRAALPHVGPGERTADQCFSK